MIKNVKGAIFSIVFGVSLLLAGCSSSENSRPAVEADRVESSAPAAMEDRAYSKSVEEKEESEELKKQKISDDDMERLD